MTSSNTVVFTVVASHSVSAPPTSNVSPLFAGVGNPISVSTGTRYVAFVAATSDPSASGNAGLEQIFLQDTCRHAWGSCTPKTILVSAGLDGEEANGPSQAPAISADGRFVAFASDASNLVANDGNRATDIFLRDTCIGAPSGCIPTTTRVSVGPAELEANGASSTPSVSADGRFVAFNSAATNLTLDSPPISSGGPATAFLRDTCIGATGPCTPTTTRQAASSASTQ